MTKKAATVGPGGVAPFTLPQAASAPAPSAPAPFAPVSGIAPPAFQPFSNNQVVSAAGASGVVPMGGEVRASDFQMQLYLKGSDVPQDQTMVKVRVLGFVKIAGSRSPLVAQIEPTFGKTFLPLNKTNIQQIARITQQDDLRCVINRVLHLTVYPVNNPQGGMTRGLYVSGAE